MNNQNVPINWYPGHMAKTKRLLQDQIKKLDLVIEICDARLPAASRNPELTGMIGSRNHLLFLNKSDLADPNMNRNWLQYFRGIGTEAYLTDAVRDAVCQHNHSRKRQIGVAGTNPSLFCFLLVRVCPTEDLFFYEFTAVQAPERRS